MKRYVAEPGSDAVREAMDRASGWFTCRVAFVETVRAVGIVAGDRAVRSFQREWPSLGVVEADQQLVEDAAALSLTHDLRSLDALHLAAALALPRERLVVATWDRRLHRAARSEGLDVLPDALAS